MTAKKPPKDLRSEPYGPGWYDAWDYVRQFEAQSGKRVKLTIEPVRSTKQQFGWRVTAALEETPTIFGCGCFGPAFPGNGQKSFAASVYRAMLELDNACAIKWATPEEVEQFCLELDSEA